MTRATGGLACLASCAALALAPVAFAAPVPGAHYTGTTNQNYPIAFDVAADGTTLSNVVTTVNGFCIGGRSGLLPYSTNSTFPFPIAGDTISGDDPDKFPYLKMRGSFRSPQQANGKLSTSNGGLQNGIFYTCNALDVEWNASTASGPVNPGPVDPGPVDPGPAVKPVVTIAFPKGVKLQPSLKNGFIVAAGVDQASTVSGRVILSAKDAKKYGLGDKARAIATDKLANAGADALLEFKVSKSVAKKLKSAKKLSLLLEVTAKRADGVTGVGSKTLKFG